MIFFIFSNEPYPDVKRLYYSQNDAFNLMLKSDFGQRNRKNEKIDIFFHSLLFLTLKYKIFSGISGYRKWSKPLPSHNFNLCFNLKKVWGGQPQNLVWGGRDGAPRFVSTKKKSSEKKIGSEKLGNFIIGPKNRRKSLLLTMASCNFFRLFRSMVRIISKLILILILMLTHHRLANQKRRERHRIKIKKTPNR